MSVKPIPDGYGTVTPTITVHEAAKAIEFYKKAFDAQEIFRFPSPDGKTIMHAEIKIGNSIVMLNDEFPQMNCRSPQSIGGTGSSIFLYVNDADATFNKAISAGAKPLVPLMDAFWGDRFGSIQDPFGHVWSIATHKKDMTPEEIKTAQEAFKNTCQ
ncbi:VOC family protein [Candidatus Nitrosotenuis chungbukensis]|uniref:VOC family protein n=1 Tax=Candidatus Nitrosotenuis chungbukensis TaxID=1353246 RepID=UPI0005B2B002|nr:VOC family protein [Candidatus Nitrosotenuis chungbukensis]WKT58481.1 VOC family protein [Candidatus Nitrosotenuis chungbukensis]